MRRDEGGFRTKTLENPSLSEDIFCNFGTSSAKAGLGIRFFKNSVGFLVFHIKNQLVYIKRKGDKFGIGFLLWFIDKT